MASVSGKRINTISRGYAAMTQYLTDCQELV